MTARQRRLASDYEDIKKNFTGHKNIIVTPIGDDEIPEGYHVTYFVNGIYLLPDGRIETLGRHEVEITLHAEYPRYKPLCKIMTPIWHPNFRDGQICIGDIWGAGESLSDIIINIGDMIQYKSWNSYSPLSADAAQWAMENKHLFPVGNIDLNVADYASSNEDVEIDLFDETEDKIQDDTAATSAAQNDEHDSVVEQEAFKNSYSDVTVVPDANSVSQDTFAAPVMSTGNDIEITAEELAGIEFVPTTQRMQTVSHGGVVKGNKLNIKTVLVKGLLWALIGAILGFVVSEFTDKNITSTETAAKLSGNSGLVQYYKYQETADEYWDKGWSEFENYCKKNNKSSDSKSVFSSWAANEASTQAIDNFTSYYEYSEKADDELYSAYEDYYDSNEITLKNALKNVTRVGTAMWSAVIALFIGLLLGIGEGVYYGSFEKAVKYAAIGAGVSVVLGFISGYLAQLMYSELLGDDPGDFEAAFIRGLGWSIMGLGVGLAVGLIKPETKRILFCAIGGFAGAFIGGFLFNYVFDIVPNDVVARGIAVIIMGILIGVGVGLLEQFAKAAWLKVIRGEFEGKEYLVFAGTTSIGNNGKNTIVLFKDKLVGPHHCDIKLEGSKYVLTDCGTPMGTVVNGQRISRHILRRGDAIAIGNSVLVFNTK